jgi:hypothetical protein
MSATISKQETNISENIPLDECVDNSSILSNVNTQNCMKDKSRKVTKLNDDDYCAMVTFPFKESVYSSNES